MRAARDTTTILALALIAACGSRDERSRRVAEGEVVVNIGGDPRTLDPQLMTDVVSSQAVNPFLRGLTSLDADGKPVPEIAERWSVSEDGRTFEFELRPAKWSDGSPVVARDFVYAWTHRLLDPAFGAEYAYLMFCVRGARERFEGTAPPESVGVEAIAPDRLRVETVGPAPFLPQLVAHNAFLPVRDGLDAESPDWALRAETFVGNGPFVMRAYSPGDRIVGERNPDYWNAAEVAMRKLTLRFVADESTERLAFETGELDATAHAPRADLDSLRGSPALRFAPLVGTYYLNFNMGDPLFADARVRRALALAIDRAAIVEHATRAGETVATGFVPPSLYDSPSPAFLPDAAFDEARRLLAEAGFPGGEGLPEIEYLYNTAEEHRAIAEVIQETWRRELGVRIVPRNLEYKALIDRRLEGDFAIARNHWIADFLDPINFLEVYLSDSGNNASHWKDPEFDALVEEARREADPAKRMEILKRAESRLIEALPVVPIFHHALPYLVAPELDGYFLNPMNAYDAARFRWNASAR